MSKRTQEILVNLAVGAIIVIAVLWLNLSRGYELTRCICDGFFVAAVLLMGIGGIKSIRNKGMFDVAGYGLKSTVEMVIPMLRRPEKEDIHEYRKRKAEERKDSVGLLLAGAVYLVLAFVSLALYYLLRQ